MATAWSVTSLEWPKVYGSLASTAAASAVIVPKNVDSRSSYRRAFSTVAPS
jgi:hypothetical protein